MKKASAKIRNEIAKLQEQLRSAEAREAERIGRIALKAGLGDIIIDEAELQIAFENVAQRFRPTPSASNGKQGAGLRSTTIADTAMVTPGAVSGSQSEA